MALLYKIVEIKVIYLIKLHLLHLIQFVSSFSKLFKYILSRFNLIKGRSTPIFL